MTQAKKPKRLAKEELQRIIELCRSVENQGLNPFLVEVEDLITIIKQYFPEWENPEELCLDAEALNQVASVIKLQSEWIKQRATSLYRDPFLIEEKLLSLPQERLASIFLGAWRPLVEKEQISLFSLSEAMKYWSELSPLDERWRNTGYLQRDIGATTREELILQGILPDESFSEILERLWEDLKTTSTEKGKIRYWNFIGAETYEETLRRAYLTSFLITYGYATLEIRPLEEEIFIIPNQKPIPKREKQPVSFPISINQEEWQKWQPQQKA